MALEGPAPRNFPDILARLWWRLDKALTLADLGPSAEVGLLDGLRAGVTTVIDHHSSPNAIAGSLDVLADAALRIGPRLCACYEVSDRDGEAAQKAGIQENVRFARAHRQDPRIAALFGLHASCTVSDKTLESALAAATDVDLPFHLHVAEDTADNQDALRRSGQRAVARLAEKGILGDGTLAAHCVHTSVADWQTLARAGAVVVTNPQSNQNNAVGAARVAEMIAHGVSLGVGTDGMEADVRQEIRAAFLLGHHLTRDPSSMWSETASLLSVNRKLASRLFGLPLGELAPGAAADVVVLDYHAPTPLSADNWLGHFLFGFYQSPAQAVVVGGQVLIQDKIPVLLDPAALAARSRESAARFWARF